MNNYIFNDILCELIDGKNVDENILDENLLNQLLLTCGQEYLTGNVSTDISRETSMICSENDETIMFDEEEYYQRYFNELTE